MLQKIVNGIAIASGVVSLTVIGLGGYVFIRKDAIIDSVKGKVMEAVTEKLGGLGDLGGGALGGVTGGLSLPIGPLDFTSSFLTASAMGSICLHYI